MQPVNDAHESRTSSSEVKSKIQYKKTHVEQYHCHREAVYAVPKASLSSRTRFVICSIIYIIFKEHFLK